MILYSNQSLKSQPNTAFLKFILGTYLCGIVGGISTFAGSGASAWSDGLGTAASFNGARGLSVSTGGDVYVADFSIHRIRMITSTGYLQCIALCLSK